MKKKIIISTIIIVVISIFIKSIDLPNENNLTSIDNFWIKKANLDKKYDVIIGGDSRIYKGISPDIISKYSNLTSVNLGFSGAGFSKEYIDYLLSNFDNKSNNKILIIGVSPHSLTDEAFKNEQFNQYRQKGIFDKYKAIQLSWIYSFFNPKNPKTLLKSVLSINNEKYQMTLTMQYLDIKRFLLIIKLIFSMLIGS